MAEIAQRENRIEIKPQAGPQTQFLETEADIAFFGGSAGGGKTFALLLECVRNINNPQFGAVVFRASSPQIKSEGGLWDKSTELFPLLYARPNLTELYWIFPKGAKVKFAPMYNQATIYDWQGSEIPLICWDELTHFSEKQFFYMLTRNRSTCGVRPYVRGTCNPDPESWVARFIDWWIGEDGYAIPERSGVIRWFVRYEERIFWGDTRQELVDMFGSDCEPKSFTFILSTIFNNKILLEKDPGYLANLKAQPLVERERLLGDPERGGNWKIMPSSGKVFNKAWFEVVEAAPVGKTSNEVRFWDLAATEKKLKGDDPDYTAGVKMREVDGVFYILDAIRVRLNPAGIDTIIKNTSSQDGVKCAVRWEQEGGASGKRDTSYLTKLLVGYDVEGIRPQGDKILRAKGLSAQAKAGNVKLVAGDWNEAFLIELHNQPDWDHDDQMDAASGAFNALIAKTAFKPATGGTRTTLQPGTVLPNPAPPIMPGMPNRGLPQPQRGPQPYTPPGYRRVG